MVVEFILKSGKLLTGEIIQCVSKKRLPFEIQISHNYSDFIVLKCVELMTRDKKRVLFTKAINRSCPIKRKSFVLRLAK